MAYSLRSISAPRLSGRALRIFARLLESPAGALFVPKLLRDTGIEAFRSADPGVAPTLLPMPAEGSTPDPTWSLPAAQLASLSALPAGSRGFRHPSVRDYERAYRAKRTDPVQVIGRALQAIEESDAGALPLRAVIAVDGPLALRQAESSAARWQAGQPLSPLDGVPICVKDELDVAGFKTYAGTKFLGRDAAKRDATVVERLRQRGAIILARTNMHEIGIGVTGANPHWGIARNPCDPRRFAGGSSGGSGAAVAAGFCPIAIGADGGGSVRIPAAFNGVFGIKASFGRVSEAGAFPLCWSVAHVGPLAWSAADLAIAYALIAGPDELDPISQLQPSPQFSGLEASPSLSGLSLGIYEPWFEHAASDVVEVCWRAVRELEIRGARLKRIEIDRLEEIRVAHALTIASEMAASMEPYDRRYRRQFSADTRINLSLARRFTSRDYVRAQRVRTLAMAEFARAFYEVDAIVTPATGVVAPLVRADVAAAGESDLSVLTEIMRFAVAANLTGNPALSLPAGYNPEGAPIGLQVIGRHWEEHNLLRIALAAEGLAERRRPALAWDLLPAAGH